MYIVFEGIDNSGKSTQIKMLYSYYKNNTNLLTKKIKEPSNSTIGKFILNFMKSEDATTNTNKEIVSLLFASDRLTQKEKILNYKDNPYNILLSDRSYISSICYQSSPRINVSWIEQLNKYMPSPDLTFILKIDTDTSINRSSQDTAYETKKQLKTIQNNYLQYAMNHKNVKLINGSQPPTKINKTIKQVINNYRQSKYKKVV